jgi:GT2 family glycosyltransferase
MSKPKLLNLPDCFVDDVYYLSRYPDVDAVGVKPVEHYFSIGWRENRSPNSLFDPVLYSAQLTRPTAVLALVHYLGTGEVLGLNPHPLFDRTYYISQCDDVLASGLNPLVHYLLHGGRELRSPHPLFDARFYASQLPVGQTSNVNALCHFLDVGWKTGLNPHARFDTNYYLEMNQDVVSSGINPLVHFVMTGKFEGRSPSPDIPRGFFHSFQLAETDSLSSVVPKNFNSLSTLHSCLRWRYENLLFDWVFTDPRLTVGFNEGTVNNQSLVESMARELSELRIDYDDRGKVDVSIIVPVHNKIIHTMGCLRAILRAGSDYRFEIIVTDDGSADFTFEILDSLSSSSIRVVKNTAARGFLHNCNSAVREASGEYLVLLNNDTIVLPGWLDELVRTIGGDPKVGLVGAKLIDVDGTLQECGGLVWQDANAWNVGRGMDPCIPVFNFLREVDYCSGAAMAMPTALWRKFGGFDERYAPAYYEDTDLAFRLRAAGYKTVVQPLSWVLHFEGISHGKTISTGIKKYQEINRETFRNQWKQTLSNHPSAALDIHFEALTIKGKTILVVDEDTPRPDHDSGSIDTLEYIRALVQFGYHVVFLPKNCVYLGSYTQAMQRIGVECLYAPYINSPDHAIQAIGDRIDAVLVFRFHVAQLLLPIIRKYAPAAKIVLETVDLHYLRESRMAHLGESEDDLANAEKMKTDELTVIDSVDATILLSEFEMKEVRKELPFSNLHCIPIPRESPVVRLPIRPDNRNTLLFVGGFKHLPNVDGIIWFVSDVWPHLVRRNFRGKLVIVGSDMPDSVKKLASENIEVKGFVENLDPLYAECRVTIAPLRVGAGVKGKIISSLGYGVPCVSTEIGVEGAGLKHDSHVLVADDPVNFAEEIIRVYEDDSLWQRLSDNGRDIFQRKFSTESVFPKIRKLLDLLGI